MPREGDTLAGRYRLATQLGAGGMSAVWLAQDAELDRRVAVKLLAPTADPMRFEREVRAHAACSHSNVACVFDFGEIEGRPYLVLEHLPGGTLEDRLSAGALPDDETIRIAREVATGMAHAHARGLVHRDLKPANILFDDEGRAKVADFGIAYATDASTFTDAGTILGTAAYASPEQADDRPVTPASDVYSFGVILFRMLTGRLPFEAPSSMELLVQHAQADPPPVRQFRGDAPPQLEALVASALAKDPSARPSDGAALLAALGDGTAPAPDTAVTEALPRAQRRPARRAVLGGAAALAVLGLAGTAAAILAFGSNPSAPARAPAGTQAPAPQPGSASGPSSTSPTSSTPTTRATTADDGTGGGPARTTPAEAESTSPAVTSPAPATTAEPATTDEATSTTEATTTAP